MSDFSFILPTKITDAILQSTNVPEAEYDAWVGGTGVFAALNQTSRQWHSMAASPNGDVYACVANGDIYKQTGGTGNFVALGQTSRNWTGMAASPNGDVYACVANGDIYKQTGGTGVFAALNQTSRMWRAMAVAPNGDVYACVYNGDIYKQTGGAGAFVELSQTTRDWFGLAASPNGDVYACVYNGGIYKQAGGAGNFVALGQTSRLWVGMAASPNGDVYACVYNGDIYKQAGGIGNFVGLSQTKRNWYGMAAAPNGDVYACVYNGDIYKSAYVPVYSQEDQVIKNHVIYESLTNNNKNNDPETDTTNWLEVGPTNRWACYDGTIGNQSTQAESMLYILAPGAVDAIALLNLESSSVEIDVIDNNDNLVTNGTAWTGATGTTQPTGWDKVGTPADYLIDSGMIKITTDAANEGCSQTIAVSAATEYQLLGKYKNTAGDIAQIAILSFRSATGSVTRSNMKLSAVNGTAFVDFSTANILTDYVPDRSKLTITDSAGKKLIGYIKAAGTGETLGDETVSGFTNLSYDVFTTDGANITNAEQTTAGVKICLQNYSYQSLALYKSVVSLSLVSGAGPFFGIGTANSLGGAATNAKQLSNGVNTNYHTPIYFGACGFYNLSNSKWNTSGISLKQVLTPSATGVTITSTADGSTYNWATKEEGFNYNDANGYSYEIEYTSDILATTGLASSTVESVFSHVFTTPAGCTSVRISLMGKASGDIVWFDDVILAPTEYSETVTTGASKTDLVKLDLPKHAGDVYASVAGGDIYKQAGRTGDFVELPQTTRIWRGMAAAPNGDVYACVYNGDIYKQAGGIGDFVGLSQTKRNWYGMAASPNGDVYASVYNGDIYKQTGGAGNFVALGQTTRTWRGMAVAPNGDVYACVAGGDIYKQTGGVGNFVALSQTSCNWTGMAAAPNGDVYACVVNGDIYKQTGGTGAFVALNQTTRDWFGLAASPNGDVYACVYSGDIYKQAGGTGDFVALGQTSRQWVGMAVAPNNALLTVKITNTGGTAKVGEIIVGKKTIIGLVEYAPGFGIKSWSTKSVDTYGKITIVKRGYSKWVKAPIRIAAADMDEVARVLSIYKDTPIVWVVNQNYTSMIVYGFYSDFAVVWPHLDYFLCNIELEGLT